MQLIGRLGAYWPSRFPNREHCGDGTLRGIFGQAGACWNPSKQIDPSVDIRWLGLPFWASRFWWTCWI